MRYMRRIGREGIWNIEVNRDSIAVHLPVGGDGYFLPTADIVFGPVEINRSVSGFTDPVELPVAIERFVERRGCVVGLEGHWGIGVRDESTVGGFLVYPYDLGIFPIGPRRVCPGCTCLKINTAGKNQ